MGWHILLGVLPAGRGLGASARGPAACGEGGGRGASRGLGVTRLVGAIRGKAGETPAGFGLYGVIEHQLPGHVVLTVVRWGASSEWAGRREGAGRDVHLRDL